MKILVIYIFYLVLSVYTSLANAEPPPLQHAGQYDEKIAERIQIEDYWVSEKLDGVRAFWDGRVLMTRQGNRIYAPDWFTDALGRVPLDGELWMARGAFEEILSIVSRDEPDERWQTIKFMVFDLPAHPGVFSERVEAMQRIISHSGVEWLQMIPQKRFATIDAMEAYHQHIVDLGGEGLMMHHQNAYYQDGRVNHLLKVKQAHDMEAKVIKHLPGKGKYKGMMGSLLVELSNGVRFKIGTGFSDQERANPPKVGSYITFRYNGFTDKGIPRFARFLRVRSDSDAPDW